MREFPLYVLREYAFAADGERGMLVGPRGEIAWMCAPRWESPAIFSTLIGGDGVYAVTPANEPFVWGGHYEPGTLIWRSRWTTTSQAFECREALVRPGDEHTAVILRRVMADRGDATVRVILDPRADFGKHAMSRLTLDQDGWTARCGSLYLRWSGGGKATVGANGRLELDLAVQAGQHHDFVLEISDQRLPKTAPTADRLWDTTSAAWARSHAITGTLADRDANHAVAVLRGMTSSSGGMVAGATMALPERFQQGRNYDYRYAWIRDQCYAGQAAAQTAQFGLLDDAIRFVSARLMTDGPDMKPAYTSNGAAVPEEKPLALPGYPGGADLIGNRVSRQFQLDVFGEALLLFAAAAQNDRLTSEHWRAAELAVKTIEQRRNRPDAGIWELDKQFWTHSRLACVAGLRALAQWAPRSQAGRWTSLADSILARASSTSVHESGRWQRTPTDDRVDSALLIPAVRGAIEPTDPRTIATLDATIAELSEECYMYRFRQDERPLGMTEGAFLLCGFMTSLALHQQGREVEAARWFERNRAACGTPALFAEEFSVSQRQLRGNMPQAFVHALLLEAASRLTNPWGNETRAKHS
ncbi:MAG TPA: glycoside hydrolase family 15 protein [Galbitalea sp.]|nr:glycoside hydrolase family 15 protein [Galbitalea sp.]